VNLDISHELSRAKVSIRYWEDSLETDPDEDNTVLVTKLKRGECNIVFINPAKYKKLQSLRINYSKTEEGKAILFDIYENFLSMISTNYIVLLNEGQVLRTSLKEIWQDCSALVKKHEDILAIDEAFLEGLLYIATSRRAIHWKMEDDI